MSVPPPHAQVHNLQLALLHEINQLKLTRKGILEIEVDVRVPKLTMPSHYYKQDICDLLHTHQISKVLIYFSSKYALNAKGRKVSLSIFAVESQMQRHLSTMVVEVNKLGFICYTVFFSLHINLIKAFLQLSLSDGFAFFSHTLFGK
jgi:hypothetical protein